jgi:AcrR family transcriptional regulator
MAAPATRRRAPAGASEARERATEALLDAAERLIVEHGYAGITSRALAAEAGVNNGLVHYYFGSMEEVLLQVLERFTERLIVRQRAMYGAPGPFLEKWRTAWRYQEDDLRGGYSKIWLELQALAWNRPELRERIARVDAEWRAVLTEAIGRALDEYGVADRFPPGAVVAMVMTFAQGFALERLLGVTEGHAELLGWIEDWLQSLEARKPAERPAGKPGRKRNRRTPGSRGGSGGATP